MRLSYVQDSAGALEIVDRNDFYPFGMNFVGYYSVFDAQGSLYNYKFGTKELQETGFYDFGARMFMPDLGRWFNVDPLAEKMRRYSPYNYAFNNPIKFIDPDGMAPIQGDDPIHRLQSVTYNKKDNSYTIKESVRTITTNVTYKTNGDGDRIKVTSTSDKTANFTTKINSSGEIVSKSNTINDLKSTQETNLTNIGKNDFVSFDETTTKANGLIGPIARTFEGSVDGMGETISPLKSDSEKFKDMTPDMPGALDGPTGGFGRLGEALIKEVRGTGNSFINAATKSAKGGLESSDFRSAGYVTYQKTLEALNKILTK